MLFDDFSLPHLRSEPLDQDHIIELDTFLKRSHDIVLVSRLWSPILLNGQEAPNNKPLLTKIGLRGSKGR